MGSGWKLPRKSPENERGQALTEYSLILALVAIVVVVSLIAFRGEIQDLLDTVIDAFS